MPCGLEDGLTWAASRLEMPHKSMFLRCFVPVAAGAVPFAEIGTTAANETALPLHVEKNLSNRNRSVHSPLIPPS